MQLEIDIVSDVVCPWCIIGYKQLEKALVLMDEPVDAKLRWHPFELNPQMPPEGQDISEHLRQKYGTTPEQSAGARHRLTELGGSLGFQFDYFDGMRMVNTFNAHQLLHWAGEKSSQTALKLALFKAFFSDRKDISDVEVLTGTVSSVGLSGLEAREVLSDQRYAATVREQQAYWQDQDVSAVPTFVFNLQYRVTGAQDADTLVRILNKIRAASAA